MNFPLLKLELSKNRLSAASVAAAFLVTLPISRLVAGVTGMETGNALSTIILAWTFIGLPFAAALIGATAGAGTASDAAAAAEALLPVSAARRAAASLGAAAVLLALASALVLGAAAFGDVLAPWLIPSEKAPWNNPSWRNMSIMPYLAWLVVDILATSWVFAYLIGHGVAGGLLGLLLVALEVSGLAIFIGLRIEHSRWVSPLTGFELPLVLFLVLVKLAAAPAAARLERRPRRAAALPAAALLAGPLAAWFMAGWLAHGVDARLRLAADAPAFAYQAWESFSPTPEALAAEGRGTPLMTVRSGVLLAGKDGLRTLIPEEKSTITDLVLRPTRLYSILRDGHGKLWAQRWGPNGTELWRQEGETMILAKRDSNNQENRTDLLPTFRDALIWRNLSDPKTGKNVSAFTSPDDYARLGDKAPMVADSRSLREKDQNVAVVACGGACLRKMGRTWRLPGRARSSQEAAPHWAGGKPVYLIPIDGPSGPVVALCRDNGRVEIAWRLANQKHRLSAFQAAWRLFEEDYRSDFRALPDGTLYAFEPGDSIGLIDSAGRPASLRYGRLRPDGAALNSRPALVRREGGRTWLLWENALQEVGEDGRLVSTRALRQVDDFRVVNGGLVLDDGRKLSFLGWDGTSRRLEKPRS